MSLNHHKLFYKDPYLKTFETKILKQQQDKKGDFYITLEETAFYPTGGGQPEYLNIPAFFLTHFLLSLFHFFFLTSMLSSVSDFKR